MQRSIERLADLQKATLYVVSQQTADFNATMRKSMVLPRFWCTRLSREALIPKKTRQLIECLEPQGKLL
jgi:hypothetical protein